MPAEQILNLPLVIFGAGIKLKCKAYLPKSLNHIYCALWR